MLYIMLYVLKPLLYLIFRPKVYGNKKALKTKGKVIFISNHIALADPLLLAVICPRIIHFMAKKELFDNPVGKIFFKSLFVFPVNRGAPDIKSIKNSLALLEKGKAFGIFPEGRRIVADRMDEFELGTSLIAMRSGAPVVPIYMSNDNYRRFRFRFIVGDPIYASDISINTSRKENEQIFTGRLTNTMNRLRHDMEEICGS